jgi:hypothetical protein
MTPVLEVGDGSLVLHSVDIVSVGVNHLGE